MTEVRFGASELFLYKVSERTGQKKETGTEEAEQAGKKE